MQKCYKYLNVNNKIFTCINKHEIDITHTTAAKYDNCCFFRKMDISCDWIENKLKANKIPHIHFESTLLLSKNFLGLVFFRKGLKTSPEQTFRMTQRNKKWMMISLKAGCLGQCGLTEWILRVGDSKINTYFVLYYGPYDCKKEEVDQVEGLLTSALNLHESVQSHLIIGGTS